MLKHKLNYQLKLFLPIVIMLWAVIIGFSILQSNREKAYKTKAISARIDLINMRVVDLFENNINPVRFLRFIDRYYDESVLDDLSLTVWDAKTGALIHRIGFPAPPPEKLQNESGSVKGSYIIANSNDTIFYLRPDQAFYYNIAQTPDGSKLIQTILPNDSRVIDEVSGGWSWWLLLIGSCVAVTVITYFTTRRLTRNIKTLRTFAANAAADRDFVALDSIPNDELGEISRQIVNIYNTRKAALASRELEHQVAIKATEERGTLRRQLTNNINHELKTPASIVKGYLETIMDNPDMDEDSRRHFIMKSREHIERLCNILNDISTMTRLEEASDKIMLEEINFHAFLESVAVEIEESHLIGDMKFINEVPHDCCIRGNHTLLNAAIMNLIKNAVAYSHGTEMGVRLFTQNRRFYTFVFWDNGVGVAPEHIPMLFERFYRVDKGRSRKSGGTGLGLPIVRSSLNTIGGTISVKNREEGGLLFIFTLNRWRIDDSEQAQ